MSEIKKILGEKRYSGAITEPLHHKLSLTSTTGEINGYDIVKVISAAELFINERNASTQYRTHGTLNCLSPMIGRRKEANELMDLFQNGKGLEFKKFHESYKIYLGYVSSLEPLGGDIYREKITLLTTDDDLNLLPCGYGTNVFGDNNYNFNFNTGVDVATIKTIVNGIPTLGHEDKLELPVTEFVLYFEPTENFLTRTFNGTTSQTNTPHPDTEFGFDPNGGEDVNFEVKDAISTYLRPSSFYSVSDYGEKMFNRVYFVFERSNIRLSAENVALNAKFLKTFLLGDVETEYEIINGIPSVMSSGVIDGNIVLFDKDNYTITEINKTAYYLKKVVSVHKDSSKIIDNYGLQYTKSLDNLLIDFRFKYNPIHKISVQAFSSFVENGDPNKVEGIPMYSLKVGENDYMWRDLLTPGFIEPGSGMGVDYPFVNGVHYLFDNVVLGISPDMGHVNTFKIYYNYMFDFTLELFNY
jgi:hypothetical protein